jgi:outer membrane receptor protein involved in Fe transport
MFVYVALLLTLFLPSDDELFLSGSVVSPSGSVISDAQIVLEHTTERRQLNTQVNGRGEFTFEHLSLGSYRIVVTTPGFYDTSVEVDLDASKFIEFTLVPIETQSEEIKVIARPDVINPEAVSSQQHVDEAVIQNLPYTGRRNFVNALTLMPGVMRDNAGQIHMNGSRPDQIHYQLDGMNITDPSTGGLASNIPIDAIESVDLDLAGYSAEFGKGSGGIIRAHSQFIGEKFRWDLTDFLPGINFQRMTIAELSPQIIASGPVVARKLWFMYSGSLKYVRTFKEDIEEGSNTQNQTIADQFVKMQWNAGQSHVVTFNLLNNSEYFGNFGLSQSRPLEATTNVLTRGTTAGVSNRSLVRGTLLETIVQWSHRRQTDLAKGTKPLEILPSGWRGNFFSDRRSRSDRFHVGQTITWERTTGGISHRFKGGGEFDYAISDLTIDRRPFQYFSADVPSAQIDYFGPNSANIRNREYGAFFQDHVSVNPRLRLEAGIRADRERVVGRTNFSPRAGFSFLPMGTDQSKISGGVGLFYDSIALENLQLPQMQVRTTTFFSSDGTPSESVAPTAMRLSSDLKNPVNLTWNLTWEHEWFPRWVSRIGYLQKYGRDQMHIGALPNAGSFDLLVNNEGKSRYDSIEFSLDRPIRTDLRILASYIYSRARGRPSVDMDFPDPAIEKIHEAPEAWDTPHRFVSWGYFPLIWRTNASYSMEVRSGFPFTSVDSLNRSVGGHNAHRMPAVFVTNVSIEKEIPIVFGKRIVIRVGATNLFDRFNPRFVDTNVNSPYYGVFSDSAPRAFVARVRLVKK